MSRITFQKRQKEMKRQEKQRAKAERRAQKKLAKRTGVAEEVATDNVAADSNDNNSIASQSDLDSEPSA